MGIKELWELYRELVRQFPPLRYGTGVIGFALVAAIAFKVLEATGVGNLPVLEGTVLIGLVVVAMLLLAALMFLFRLATRPGGPVSESAFKLPIMVIIWFLVPAFCFVLTLSFTAIAFGWPSGLREVLLADANDDDKRIVEREPSDAERQTKDDARDARKKYHQLVSIRTSEYITAIPEDAGSSILTGVTATLSQMAAIASDVNAVVSQVLRGSSNSRVVRDAERQWAESENMWKAGEYSAAVSLYSQCADNFRESVVMLRQQIEHDLKRHMATSSDVIACDAAWRLGFIEYHVLLTTLESPDNTDRSVAIDRLESARSYLEKILRLSPNGLSANSGSLDKSEWLQTYMEYITRRGAKLGQQWNKELQAWYELGVWGALYADVHSERMVWPTGKEQAIKRMTDRLESYKGILHMPKNWFQRLIQWGSRDLCRKVVPGASDIATGKLYILYAVVDGDTTRTQATRVTFNNDASRSGTILSLVQKLAVAIGIEKKISEEWKIVAMPNRREEGGQKRSKVVSPYIEGYVVVDPEAIDPEESVTVEFFLQAIDHVIEEVKKAG